ncbi:hypothetical protein D3P09_15065 [Paenibacillus pinisoli]|uniref:Glycerophosphodiester phosphodiesterase n=1 Tax=Paenibacillus pinisoli TaxID=1276110 RepID=A0A3A6PGK3_9BACL|nr:hypothetical protein D3P09_15065 [Paenibacillus pinisoli]
MLKKKFQKWSAYVLVAALLAGLLPQGWTDRAHAAESPSALWITEIVPRSGGEGQPYEFIELHNSSEAAINLNQYQLQYFTSSMTNPANRWPIGNTTIGAGETKVLWLKKFDYPNVPLEDFNANYGVSMDSADVIEIALTTSAQGLHDSALRKVAIADTTGQPLVSALFNEGTADGLLNRSVIYKPGDATEMKRLRNDETPTPGTLLVEQLPGAPDPGGEPEPTPSPGEGDIAAPLPGELLITELIPDTANFAGYDAFEFIELYNAASHPVELQGHTVASASWTVTIEDSLVLPEWSTYVIWTRRGEIAPIGMDAFNSYYYAEYAGKYVREGSYRIFENIGGLTNSGNQNVTVRGITGNEIAKASYSASHVAEGKSITFRYPSGGGTAMELTGGLQAPTPGYVVAGQAPPKPVVNTEAPQAPAGLTAAGGEGSAELSWSPNGEADLWSYRIYMDGQLQFEVPASQLSFRVDGLIGNVSYDFQVSAVNRSDLESAPSAIASAEPNHQKLTQTERAPFQQPDKYALTWAIGEAGPVIPGLAEGVVPQGIAYDEGLDWLVTVSYMDDGRPGVLSVMQASTGVQLESLALMNENGTPYMGHAGGVSIIGEHVWVASETYLYRLDVADIEAAQHGGEVRFTGVIPVPLQAAFMTYADGVLWVGEFYEAKSYPTDPQHHIANRDGETHYAWMAGYELSVDTGLPGADNWNGDKAATATPDYLFSIREKVQGAAFDDSNVYLSTSYGRANDSTLFRYRTPDLAGTPHASAVVNGVTVPLWFLDGQSAAETNASLVTVPMSEGIAVAGGELYVLLESGANKYRYTTTFIMDRMLKLNLAAWENYGTEPPAAERPPVRVSQFMYDAPGADDGKEYIVLRNYGTEPVDIGGFKLGDGINEGGGEGMAEFPAGTVMEPGEVIVVSQSALIFKQTYGVSPDFEVPWEGVFRPQDDPSVPNLLPTTWSTGVIQLANGGDEILLMDRANEVVDFVPYLKDMTYRGIAYKGVTAAAGGNGNAIHRISDTGVPAADFAAAPPELPNRPIPIPTSQTLLITEVVYDPLFEEITGEYIELTNISQQPIDISGYYLGDEETEGQAAAEGMYNFPEGTVLAPYEVIVVAKNAKGIEERYGIKADFELDESDPAVAKMIPNCDWGCGNMQLANTGDEVLLLDRNKALIDVVVYRSGMYMGIEAHPGVAGGHSLERISEADTKNSRADFIDQPNPTPGLLLFGPYGRPDLIPVPDLKENVLLTEEPQSRLAAAPTIADASGVLPDTLAAGTSAFLLTVGLSGGKLMATNVNMELKDALQRLDGHRLPMLELRDRSLMLAVHGLLVELGMQDVMIVSGNAAIVKDMRELNDEYRGVVRMEGTSFKREQWSDIVIAVRNSTGLTALLDYRAASAELTSYLAARGISVWAYGMEQEADLHQAIAAGVTGLMTSTPQAAVEAIESYGEQATLSVPPLFVAHRGMSSLAPENTMDAFKLAVEMNADVIETDVLRTKDGELVLLHDFTVDRTTNGSGRASEMTLAELQALTANRTDQAAWQPIYDQFPDARIPTLTELLAYAKDKDIVLALEMKGIGYERELVDLIEQYGMVANVYVSSFSSEVLKRVHELNPQIGIGFVLDGGAPEAGKELVQAEKLITDNVQLGAFLLANTTLMTPELVAYAKQRGVTAVGWTVNTKSGMQELVTRGVGGIITDYANWMNELPTGLSSLRASGSYTLRPGAELAFDELVAVASRSGADISLNGGVRILGEASGAVELDGNLIKAVKPGHATLQFYHDFPLFQPVEGEAVPESSWRVYSAPIRVTVANQTAPVTPGDGGQGSEDASRYEPAAAEIAAFGGKLKLSGKQTLLSMPGGMSDWLPADGLSVQAGSWTLQLPSKLLQAALQALPKEQREDGRLELSMIPVEAAQNGIDGMKQRGMIMDFKLEVVDRDGNRKVVSLFSEEAAMQFQLEEGTDPWLAGIYQLMNDGTLRYAGGKVNNGYIETGSMHFSRYAVMEYSPTFHDVPSLHWGHEAITRLAAKHIAEGTGTGGFAPERPVTRAEFTALLVRALGLQATAGDMPFSDIAGGRWYADSVAAAYQAGLVSGVSEDTFAPESKITRQQMAILLVRAAQWAQQHGQEQTSGTGTSIARSNSFDALRDKSDIADWAVQEVAAALEQGLMHGRGEDRFAPLEQASRAESVQALYNFVVKLNLLP